jgi:tRNA pseudouridine55 synthase
MVMVAAQQQRSNWQQVHGVMLLDKPRGCTSQVALQQVRRALRAEKAGHTGTLDPLADGLLPLCFGAATKFAQMHLEADKAYRAVLQLGVTTTTDDGEGDVLERKDVPAMTPAQLQSVLQRFIGNIAQTPPIYSALKRAGKPLYAYARSGIDIHIPARQVRIDAIHFVCQEGDRLTLDVQCGKGTYVRALARDIGQQLGCGAHLAALRRTASGAFNISQARALGAVRDLTTDAAQACLLPVDCLVQGLPRFDLNATQATRLLHGQTLAPEPASVIPIGLVRVHGPIFTHHSFLGVAQWDGHALAPQRLLSNEELQAQ